MNISRAGLLLFFLFILGAVSYAQDKPIFLNGTLLNQSTLEPISDLSFSEVTFKDDGLILGKTSGKWAFLDYMGREISKSRFSWYPIFHEGIALHAMGGLSAEHFGIDERGEKVFGINAKDIKPFKHGLAALIDKDYKHGFIDKKGKEVISPKFDGFKETVKVNNKIYHSVKKGDGWGLVNANGKEVLPFKYEGVSWLMGDYFLLKVIDKENPTSAGSFGATIKNYDFGIWSLSKGMIVKPNIDHIIPRDEFLKLGLLVGRMEKGSGLGLIDFSGKTVLPSNYHDVALIGDDLIKVSQLATQTNSGNWALSDMNGNLKTQYLFDYIGVLGNGLISVCVVQQGRRGCGYVDEKAQLKIPLNFARAGVFNSLGEAKVGYNKKVGARDVLNYGIINKNNEPVLPLIFGEIERVSPKYYKASAPNNVYEHLLDAVSGEPIDTKNAAYLLRDYGFYYLQLGKFEKGATYYQQIVDLGKGTNEDKHYLGLAYGRAKHYEKAAKYLNQVIDLPRTDKTEVLLDATIEMGNLMFAQNRLEDGKVLYNQAILDRPANGQVRMRFAETLSNAMLEAEAIVQYQEVIKVYPKAWEVYQKMGVSQLKIDRKAESIVSLNKAIEFNPQAKDSYFFRGQAYAINQEHVKAIKDFEKAILLDGSGEMTTVHKYLADAYKATQELPKACSLWKQMAQFDEDSKVKMNANCNN